MNVWDFNSNSVLVTEPRLPYFLSKCSCQATTLFLVFTAWVADHFNGFNVIAVDAF